MHVNHLLVRIQEQTRTFAAPYAKEKDDSGGENRHLKGIIQGFVNTIRRTQTRKKIDRYLGNKMQRFPVPLSVDINDMTA
jgi:hypothetical protein